MSIKMPCHSTLKPVNWFMSNTEVHVSSHDPVVAIFQVDKFKMYPQFEVTVTATFKIP